MSSMSSMSSMRSMVVWLLVEFYFTWNLCDQKSVLVPICLPAFAYVCLAVQVCVRLCVIWGSCVVESSAVQVCVDVHVCLAVFVFYYRLP